MINLNIDCTNLAETHEGFFDIFDTPETKWLGKPAEKKNNLSDLKNIHGIGSLAKNSFFLN